MIRFALLKMRGLPLSDALLGTDSGKLLKKLKFGKISRGVGQAGRDFVILANLHDFGHV